MSKVNKKELIKALKDVDIIKIDTSIGYDEKIDCYGALNKVPSTSFEITLTCIRKNKKEKQIIEIDGIKYEIKKI